MLRGLNVSPYHVNDIEEISQAPGVPDEIISNGYIAFEMRVFGSVIIHILTHSTKDEVHNMTERGTFIPIYPLQHW